MSEQELKNKIYEHMKAIRNLCLEYCGEEDWYLSISMFPDIMWISNQYWEEGKKSIDFTWFAKDIENGNT